MFEDFPIVKFLILWIPFTIFVFIFAPTFKWKFSFALCGALGIYLGLNGKTMKGFTPMARRSAR